MNRLVLLACWWLATVVVIPVAAQSVDQKQTIKRIRNLRKAINGSEENAVIDSLSIHLNTLLDATRKTNGAEDLMMIHDYVSLSYDAFISAESPDEKKSIVESVNRDLTLKLYQDVDGLPWAGNTSFGKMITIKVEARIDGAPLTNGNYRLYWGYYLGRELSELVSLNLHEGSSDGYQNPYELNVRIPGNICFWLKDEQGNQYYLPLIKFKKLVGAPTETLMINFKAQ